MVEAAGESMVLMYGDEGIIIGPPALDAPMGKLVEARA